MIRGWGGGAPKNMYHYRMETTPLLSLIAANFALEVETRMTALYWQN